MFGKKKAGEKEEARSGLSQGGLLRVHIEYSGTKNSNNEHPNRGLTEGPWKGCWNGKRSGGSGEWVGRQIKNKKVD